MRLYKTILGLNKKYRPSSAYNLNSHCLNSDCLQSRVEDKNNPSIGKTAKSILYNNLEFKLEDLEESGHQTSSKSENHWRENENSSWLSMLSFRFVFALILMLFISSFAFAQVDAALIDIYPALSLENPSYDSRGLKWYADFYRPYAGIDDMIYSGGLIGKYGFSAKSSALLAIDYFSSDMYYRASIGAGFGMNFGKFAIGATPRIILDGFNSRNFHRTGDETVIDPYFANGESQNGFTADFGASYTMNFGHFGVYGKNLLPVDLSPEVPERDAIEPLLSLASKHPIYGGFLNLGIAYDLAAPDGKELDFSFGYTRNIYSIVGLAASYDISRSLLDAGISIEILDNLALGYTFEYPMTNVSKVATSHRIALAGSALPYRPKPNLTISIESPAKRVDAGETTVILAKVSNYEQPLPGPARVVVFAGSEIIEDQTIQIEQGKTESIRIQVNQQEPTDYLAVVDYDDEIRETNENDNRDMLSIGIRQKPILCNLKVTPNELHLTNITYTYQDHSMVPVVFFDHESSLLDDRFDFLMDVIAERIENNPDVLLDIAGYVTDEEFRSTLPDRRAIAVLDAILDRIPKEEHDDIRERIDIVIPEDTTALAVPKYGASVGDTALLQAENRRAEIFADIKLDMRKDVSYGENPKYDYRIMKDMMRRNPDLVIVIAANNKEGNMELAMDEAFRLKRQLVSELGEDMQHRVYPSVARMTGDANESEIFLSPEGILYQPYVFAGSRETDPDTIPKARIMLTYEGTVLGWSIEAIEEETGEYLGEVAKGQGAPPKSIRWDFSSDRGELLPIGRAVRLRMIMRGTNGSVDTCENEKPIETIIKEKEIFDQKMLLVQFEFDRPAAQSRYLEDRLEVVAQNIVEQIKQSKRTRIEIEGHTDIIGKTGRNQQLSYERAQAVERLLRNIIANIVELPSDGKRDRALDKWLDRHNAEIEAIGYGEEKPLDVEVYRQGSMKKLMIGDNSLPEGRRINRSVMVKVWGER
ncbi:MAG: OmpA family protein [Candidatus Zixiibacteriota bacterium]